MQRKVYLLIMNNISAEWLSMERNECVCFKFYEVGINLPRMDYRVNSNTIATVHRPTAKYIRSLYHHGVNRSSFHWLRISFAIC